MEKNSLRRRGSALVIVLGILAVMMLMAVAFSTFVRTERGGSTNLKNSFVARTSLFTALGRAMEAIDLSFGSATNDDPVAAWPEPWLASAEGGDHFQSAALGEGETAGAHVLTDKIAKHLTPAQLALARSAKCNWAPIYSSISASPANSARRGGSYGEFGRPTEDSLIGRYAFIALDTTGLLDMNQTGVSNATARAKSSGDPMTFLPAYGVAQVTKGNSSVDAPPFVLDPDEFKKKREAAHLFHSMADAKTICGKSVLAIDETKTPSNEGAKPAKAGDFFPADLYAGFAPSLAETSPGGTPKIRLPPSSEFDGYSNARVKKFLGRVFRAMVAVFARSRAVAGIGVSDTSSDDMPIYQSVAEYALSPAALAAVSLMDGLDSDNVPGRFEGSSSSLGYWKNLASSSVKVEGTTVTEDTARYADLSALDFPCTESVPLIDGVYAHVQFDQPTTNGLPLSATSTVTYNGTITVEAYAHCLNKTESDHSHSSKIMVEWEVMETKPQGGTITGDGGDSIRQKLEGNMTVAGGGGTGRPGQGGGGAGTPTKAIDWSGVFEKDGSVMGGDGTSSDTVNDSSSSGSRFLRATSSQTIKVVCHCYSNLVASGGSGGGVGRPGQGGGTTTVEWKPYPMTAVEYAKTGDQDVFLPIRVRVSILDADNHDKVQQQVPGPAIDSKDNGTENKYWVRVNPGVYHNPGIPDASKKSKYGGAKGDPIGMESGSANSGIPKLAAGWALCAAPAFAFDTTSLLNAGNQMNFWVNDEMARQAADEGGGGGGVGRPDGGGGGGNPMFSKLKTKFWTTGESGSPNNAVRSRCLGPRGGGSFGYLLEYWLFNDSDKVNTTRVTSWMSKSGGRVPDLLHSASKAGGPFVAEGDTISSQRRGEDLYSRIPVGGYATVADLGRVMCGPYETLSLFKTWRPNSGRADFHPVMDYFTMDEDRYPKQSQVEAKTDVNGEVNWTALGQGGKDLYSAIHNGRVNLNAPPLVELTKDGGKRGRRSGCLNPYPIAAALCGASPGTNSTDTISDEKALILASSLCRMVENSNLPDMKVKSEVWGTERKVVRNLSFLGMGEDDMNTLLDDFVNLAHPKCDVEREGMLGGIVDAFTTRGQTYLVIIRADAYSPKFGENDSVQDGTTLATTHAIVELFRDPVPAHGPDGVLLPSDGEGPVAYHNWYIRSFRVF